MLVRHLGGLAGRATLCLAVLLGGSAVMAASWDPAKPFIGAVPPARSDLYDPFWSLAGPEYQNPYLFNQFLSRQLAYPSGPYPRDYVGPRAPSPQQRYLAPGPYGVPSYQYYGHYYPYYSYAYPYVYRYPYGRPYRYW
jgi:hypothetical protein